MAEYELKRLRKVGDADMYEVKLPDGSTNRFIYSGAQQAVETSNNGFARWLAISDRRAQRDSDYRAGVRNAG